MDFKDILEKLKQNPELAKSLEDAVGRNADAEELCGILAKANIDATTAESIVATYQRKRGMVIAEDELDEETLRKVAGGGTGLSCDAADDCDKHYKDSGYWGIDHCSYSQVCDEAFW